MSFEFMDADIAGIKIIRPHIYSDMRGTYVKNFEKIAFSENGLTTEFSESSDLYTRKGALRGLHYQSGKDSQAKLVRVISGKLFDVALDLREGSETFGKYHAELMDGVQMKAVFIPAGFAHGFIALEDDTVFSYQSSGKYVPEETGGILWNDPGLGIPWPLKEYGIKEVTVTDRDRNWPTLAAYEKTVRGEKS